MRKFICMQNNSTSDKKTSSFTTSRNRESPSNYQTKFIAFSFTILHTFHNAEIRRRKTSSIILPLPLLISLHFPYSFFCCPLVTFAHLFYFIALSKINNRVLKSLLSKQHYILCRFQDIVFLTERNDIFQQVEQNYQMIKKKKEMTIKSELQNAAQWGS